MSINKCIFLIGMPGTGKSYWAEQLSERFNLAMLDTDDIIEEEENCSINELFDIKGEDYFRQREKEVLEGIITQQKEVDAELLIIACGGGMPCYHNNMQTMLKAGRVIYLQSAPATLIERLLKEFQTRPMLKEQENLLAFAAELLAQRQVYYKQAHDIFDTEMLSLITFEPIIKKCIEQL